MARTNLSIAVLTIALATGLSTSATAYQTLIVNPRGTLPQIVWSSSYGHAYPYGSAPYTVYGAPVTLVPVYTSDTLQDYAIASSLAPAQATPAPPAASQQPPQTVTPALRDGDYLVQVGVFAQPRNVERYTALLNGMNLQVYHASTPLKGKAATKVLVGAWQDKRQARQTARRVASALGLKTLVVSAATLKR